MIILRGAIEFRRWKNTTDGSFMSVFPPMPAEPNLVLQPGVMNKMVFTSIKQDSILNIYLLRRTLRFLCHVD